MISSLYMQGGGDQPLPYPYLYLEIVIKKTCSCEVGDFVGIYLCGLCMINVTAAGRRNRDPWHTLKPTYFSIVTKHVGS